jgi:hypothetical protein
LISKTSYISKKVSMGNFLREAKKTIASEIVKASVTPIASFERFEKNLYFFIKLSFFDTKENERWGSGHPFLRLAFLFAPNS